ncbi:hypothetical protein CUT44_19110 [Streptomyces carminius]|uniref:Uncharacterized protein n=1 Tax=Streptomyces carminius TaxID=2665496 RepID=A0A2M8LVE9_9ACTN|nr:hypothetical protein [Streptomyces carminius]PJE95925.1 hypothetical protein CUT44_19110 [Streptomyces carminius]
MSAAALVVSLVPEDEDSAEVAMRAAKEFGISRETVYSPADHMRHRRHGLSRSRSRLHADGFLEVLTDPPGGPSDRSDIDRQEHRVLPSNYVRSR